MLTEREGALKAGVNLAVGAATRLRVTPPRISHITPKSSCQAESQCWKNQVDIIICRISVKSAWWSLNCFAASEIVIHCQFNGARSSPSSVEMCLLLPVPSLVRASLQSST